MPRDEFTAEAFFTGFTDGWTAAGGVEEVGGCPVPEPYFSEVEYLIDQVRKKKCSKDRQSVRTYGRMDVRTGIYPENLLADCNSLREYTVCMPVSSSEFHSCQIWFPSKPVIRATEVVALLIVSRANCKHGV